MRVVHIYGIDLNPTTGATSDRDWGTIGVDPGPAKGAATGRWRYRPPCALSAPDLLNFKDCSGPPGNSYLPPTREVRAVIQGFAPIAPTSPVAATESSGASITLRLGTTGSLRTCVENLS